MKDKKFHPIKYVLLIMICIFLILAALRYKKHLELEEYGVYNTANVTIFKHVNMLTNAKGGQRISYYIIEFEYIYEESNYSKKIELKGDEVYEKFGKLPKPGDEINIIHSRNDPENVRIADKL